MAFQNSLFWLADKRSVKTHILTVVRIFRIWSGVPDVVFLAGSFKLCIVVFLDVSPLQTCVSLKFTDKNFKQPNCFWLSMHAYRTLLPSEADDSRFNSREKHTLTDSVQAQPYNKPIIDLACSVCTVKYQTSVSILKKLGLIFHSIQTSRSVNKPLLLYGWDKCRTLIGWLPVWKKSSCPLKKFILPAQEIYLARSWKHCTNKILKETKVYYAIQCRRKTLSEWVLLSWRNKWPKCYVSRRR